jgi:hypothetical protein
MRQGATLLSGDKITSLSTSAAMDLVGSSSASNQDAPKDSIPRINWFVTSRATTKVFRHHVRHP